MFLFEHKWMQQTQYICKTFVQCWTSVEDVGTMLHKWYTHVLCLLKYPLFLHDVADFSSPITPRQLAAHPIAQWLKQTTVDDFCEKGCGGSPVANKSATHQSQEAVYNFYRKTIGLTQTTIIHLKLIEKPSVPEVIRTCVEGEMRRIMAYALYF